MTLQSADSLNATYMCPDGTAFPVQWPNAEAAGFVWARDQVKNPTPLTPRARHFRERKRAGMARASEQIGRPSPSERIHANGYVFARSLPVSKELAKQSVDIAAGAELVYSYGELALGLDERRVLLQERRAEEVWTGGD